MARVYLSLGSNIEPRRHLRAALAALRAQFGTIVVSPVYRTRAVGFEGEDFLNAGVGIDTSMQPQDMNDWLHALEAAQGRRREGPRFSSRTLDIDMVLYGQRIVDGPGHLQIPRSDLRHAFVLKPLFDIAPDAVVPGDGRTLAQLWAEHPDHDNQFETLAPAEL
ncbi:2-amino-4-hydroxy-6-hydroxymethyldihydropteridine diphosphokinase [Oleiagrimonas sp.]|jgi:2-amino-4-hydroxy-6-hydroxymethyldihydropteridine diphosphokinase|uniref:2-amino-4-hydroxy-6- hydroxymethyldihydropteridine diphosphokinase n=1 Tax=Oleiagrimonas sp. TaxID=2010330 RepID=UPI002632C91B|nr:2-amino-4-hydroxy-6-hydroxymethyldihydropteridine diphosphokinase [Oleiagrimonas sp.]MDA3914265.1 2-amino-4-hydroxy-6-hydroxymethyldihydropteridine diphosphokinase [Oleiagrimonas sp.]